LISLKDAEGARWFHVNSGLSRTKTAEAQKGEKKIRNQEGVIGALSAGNPGQPFFFHIAWGEWIFGRMTRELLSTSWICRLMSHLMSRSIQEKKHGNTG